MAFSYDEYRSGSCCHAATGARIVPWRQPGDWALNSSDRLHRAPSALSPTNHGCVSWAHQFTKTNHACKRKCIQVMETEKLLKYLAGYRDKGYTFARMVANPWTVCTDLIRSLWTVADHTAPYQVSIPDSRLRFLPQQLNGSHSASQTAAADSQISAFKALRGCLNVEYRQRVLTAVYEAITERLYGHTYALSSAKLWLDSAVWQPVFNVLPCDGPSAAASECSSILLSSPSAAPDSLPPALSLL